MVQQDYFIGFDIGTDSVGWAVTDPQYKILKRMGRRFGACAYLTALKRQQNVDVTAQIAAVWNAGSSELPGSKSSSVKL